MATTLELYEALKVHVGEEAARMIAEALPLSDRVVTESYLDARLDARLGSMEARIFRWIGVIATLILKL